MKMTIFAAVLLMLLPVTPAFPADSGKKTTQEGFTFVLPPTWQFPKEEQRQGRRKEKEKIVLLTKDGAALDQVEFRKRLVTAELVHTKKKMTPAMMPQELAEVLLNEFELNDGLKNFKLIENKPATVAGVPGFKLVFSYKSNGQLSYQCVYYGFRKDEMLYTVLYLAPKRHYYETNLGTFEQMVKSLTVQPESFGGLQPAE